MTGMMLLAAAFRKESYGLGLVLAVVCGGILAVMLFDVFRKRICCTEAVLAEVTKVVSASAISGGGAAFRFAPEYQYDYNGQTYTDTRTEPIAMTGHAWNAPVFTWTEDGEGYSATATFTCGKCGDSRTENAEVTRIRHTDATCTKQEVSIYKAEYDGYSENKTVYGDALGHDWSDWSIVWNDDYTAFATRRCGRGSG